MNDVVELVPCEGNDCEPLEDWEALQELLFKLVRKREDVRVEQETSDHTTYLRVHVAPEDLGKVIGKNGETVSLLRRLFGRMAATHGRKIFIEVEDTTRIRSRTRAGYRRNAAA